MRRTCKFAAGVTGLMRSAVLVGLAVALCGSSFHQQLLTEPTLDIRTIPQTQDHRGLMFGRECVPATGAASGEPPATKVTLLPLDRQLFVLGEDIVFEVLIERVRGSEIDIGIARDPDLAPNCRMAEDDVRSHLSLLSRGDGRVDAVGPTLYGSSAVPGTTLELHAGERLRVRVPAKIHAARPTLFEPPQLLQVVAMFSAQRGRVRTAGEFSNNSQEIGVGR
jgi:hypothetical protein